MGQSIKSKIAKATSSNIELNKKVIRIKKSWDEVNELLRTTSKRKK